MLPWNNKCVHCSRAWRIVSTSLLSLEHAVLQHALQHGLKRFVNLFMWVLFIPPGLFTKKDMQTPPPPSQKWPHHVLIVYDAQCSESNENVNQKLFQFLFFQLSSKIGVIFQKNDTKMAITRKIKIWKLVLLSNEPISNLPCEFQKFKKKKNFASLFCSYVVSELARFARGRIEDSRLTGSRSTAFYSLQATLYRFVARFARIRIEDSRLAGSRSTACYSLQATLFRFVARFARVRIEDSRLTGSRSTAFFSLQATLFFKKILSFVINFVKSSDSYAKKNFIEI